MGDAFEFHDEDNQFWRDEKRTGEDWTPEDWRAYEAWVDQLPEEGYFDQDEPPANTGTTDLF